MSDSRTVEDQLNDAVDALGHIEVVCQRSRSQSRRMRWIAVRARDGMDGGTQHQRVDLPKSANSEMREKLRRKKAEMLCEEMADVLASFEKAEDLWVPTHADEDHIEEAQALHELRHRAALVLRKYREEDQS